MLIHPVTLSMCETGEYETPEYKELNHTKQIVRVNIESNYDNYLTYLNGVAVDMLILDNFSSVDFYCIALESILSTVNTSEDIDSVNGISIYDVIPTINYEMGILLGVELEAEIYYTPPIIIDHILNMIKSNICNINLTNKMLFINGYTGSAKLTNVDIHIIEQ